MKKYNVAVVGAGAVGVEMLRVLRQRNFPVGQLKVLARSAREISVDGQTYKVEPISADSFKGMHIALFAGTEGEKGAAVTYAEAAAKNGCLVIDNGADFRMDKDVPLVVPEVNPKDIKLAKGKKGRGIIANPNCSTIQMVVALKPIHKLLKIKRVIVSTYQAASGAGSKAVEELYNQTRGVLDGQEARPEAMSKRIAFNIFPHIGSFAEDDFTSEEWKMIKETHKIMGDDKIAVSSTTVRVPVKIGHSEAVYIETAKPVDIKKVKATLAKAPGIKLVDDVKTATYPMPIEVEGKDEVFVGRVRKDPYNPKGLWLWIVADNLRKGAASNAVQIAEEIVKMNLV